MITITITFSQNKNDYNYNYFKNWISLLLKFWAEDCDNFLSNILRLWLNTLSIDTNDVGTPRIFFQFC